MKVCRFVDKYMSCAEAVARVLPAFEILRDQVFGPQLPRVRRTRLACAGDRHDTPRHFASCRDDGSVVTIAPEFALLPPDRITAVLAHELGHASDFWYPGRFHLLRDRSLLITQRPTEAELAHWESRGRDVREITADSIAEHITGLRIRYSGPCVLQTFGSGRRRPVGLR